MALARALPRPARPQWQNSKFSQYQQQGASGDWFSQSYWRDENRGRPWGPGARARSKAPRRGPSRASVAARTDRIGEHFSKSGPERESVLDLITGARVDEPSSVQGSGMFMLTGWRQAGTPYEAGGAAAPSQGVALASGSGASSSSPAPIVPAAPRSMAGPSSRKGWRTVIDYVEGEQRKTVFSAGGDLSCGPRSVG